MHGLEMNGGMSEEKKGDGMGHHGVTTRSKFTCVDNQGGDQINHELYLADMEDVWRLLANHGKDGVAEDSSEANLWEASVPKKEVEAIKEGRRGFALSVLGDWFISVLDEGSDEEEESG